MDIESLSYEDLQKRVQALEKELSELRYRDLIHQEALNASSVAVMATQEGRFVFTNPAGARLLGFSSPEEAVGVSVLDVIAPEYHPLVLERSENIAQGFSNRPIELGIKTKDGSAAYIESTSIPMFYNSHPTTWIIGQDITDRKTIEQRLQESEEKYRSVFENSSTGVSIVDPEGRIMEANSAVSEILGYSKEEIVNKTIEDVTHPDDLENSLTQFHKLLSGEIDSYRIDKRYIHKDGRVVWCVLDVALVRDSKGMPLYTSTQIMDITAKKHAEDALKKSEERFRLIGECSIDDIWQLDLDGNIMYVSPAVERIFGYSREEALRLNFTDFFTKEELPKAVEAFQKALSGEHKQLIELNALRKDGSSVPIEVSITPIVKKGEILGVQGIARDISDRKEAEREKEITIEFLRLINRQSDLYGLMKGVTELFHRCSDCETVGIRLRDDEYCPYFEYRGLDKKFIRMESRLCSYDKEGKIERDEAGYPVPECMCGNVIHGRFDPALPFFTPKGSFWTNSTSELPASSTEKDRQARTRNRCNGEGYESVALIPLKSGDETFGLIRMSDRRKGRFNEKSIAMFERLVDSLALGMAHRIAAKKLAESEERYRAVVENANEGIIVIQDGMLQFWNRQILEWSGYGPKDLARSPFEFLHPEDSTRVSEIHQNRIDGRKAPSSYDFKVLDKNGNTLWLSANVDEIDWYGKPAFLAMLTDITERKKNEEKLKAEEERFREVFNNTGSGIAVYEVVGDGEDFVFKDINPAGACIGNKERDEHIGKSVKVVYPNVNEFGIMDVFRHVWRTGEAVSHPLSMYRDRRVAMWVENYVFKLPSGEIVAVYDDVTEQKQVQDDLRMSEEKYRRIIETAYEGVWEVDRKGRTAQVNRRITEMLGYTREEIIGQPFFRFMDKAGAIEAKKLFRKRSMGESGQHEKRFKRKDGSDLWAIISSTPSMSENGDFLGTVAMLTDITDRKHTEKALADSEERYRSLVELSPEVVYVHIDGEFTYINPAGAAILGAKDPDELIGLSMYDFMHPDSLDIAKARTERLQREKGILPPMEMKIRTLDRKIIHVEATGAYIQFMGKPAVLSLMSDITERKKVEEELRVSERKFRDLVDNADEIITVMQDDFIRFANRKLFKVTGLAQKKLPANAFDLVHPDDRSEFTASHRALMRGESYPRHSEFRIHDRKGEVVWLSANTVGVEWEGKPAALVIATDITERKLAEEERLKLESQLRQAQKMEAIGALAGGIAHDFNNILWGILGFTELSLQEAPEGSVLEENLQQVLTASHRAKELIKQILAFSRMSEQERTPVNIAVVVKEAIKLLRASLPSTITIRHSVHQGGSTVMADPIQVHQVLMNLCTNALHAMERNGGLLEIKLMPVDLDGSEILNFGELSPGPYVKLSVRDSGAGMNADTMERIFEPYYTTKEKETGTGMGLAVVHGIVRAHNGGIQVYSEPGRGSTFEVYLPRILKEAGDFQTPSDPLPKGSERILFIDDEEALVELLLRMLSHLGYKVTAMTNSTEALDLFRSQPGHFDLVITDLTMPELTGDRLTQEIIRLRSDVPIILCTGFSEKISVERAKEIGVAAFLMKPIVLRDLANTIRQVLDGK